MAPIARETLETEIARLRGLDLPALRAVWKSYYKTPAPKTLRRDMLVRSIAWRIQADAAGGLKPATLKYLRQVAEGARSPRSPRSGTAVRAVSNGRIKPGTKLIRVWQDQTHTVTALADGFEWQGSRYRSLSKIACTITGTRWNGLVFFGVKTRPVESNSVNRTKAVRREAADA
jgi:hypothetical protein